MNEIRERGVDRARVQAFADHVNGLLNEGGLASYRKTTTTNSEMITCIYDGMVINMTITKARGSTDA